MMKENRLRLLLNVCLFFITISAQAALHDTLFVADYGVHPNTYEDQTARLQTLIADCKRWKSKAIVFQSGRYDLWPTDASRREYYISNTSSETECRSKVKTIGLLFEEICNRKTPQNKRFFEVFLARMRSKKNTFRFAGLNSVLETS